MNCRGFWQRFLPLLDLSRKIEGDSVRRVLSSKTLRRSRLAEYLIKKYGDRTPALPLLKRVSA